MIQVPGLVYWTGDTGSRPIINSLKSASPKPSKIFVATLLGSGASKVKTKIEGELFTGGD